MRPIQRVSGTARLFCCKCACVPFCSGQRQPPRCPALHLLGDIHTPGILKVSRLAFWRTLKETLGLLQSHKLLNHWCQFSHTTLYRITRKLDTKTKSVRANILEGMNSTTFTVQDRTIWCCRRWLDRQMPTRPGAKDRKKQTCGEGQAGPKGTRKSHPQVLRGCSFPVGSPSNGGCGQEQGTHRRGQAREKGESNRSLWNRQLWTKWAPLIIYKWGLLLISI